MLKWLRGRFAKPLCVGSNPTRCSKNRKNEEKNNPYYVAADNCCNIFQLCNSSWRKNNRLPAYHTSTRSTIQGNKGSRSGCRRIAFLARCDHWLCNWCHLSSMRQLPLLQLPFPQGRSAFQWWENPFQQKLKSAPAKEKPERLIRPANGSSGNTMLTKRANQLDDNWW